MFPWAMLVSLAGQAVSGIASAINNKKIQQTADSEAARQQAFYAGKAAEDPVTRSENQRLLNQYDRDSERQVETARNIGKITGATPEYGLGVQKAVAEGRANLMSNMAAGASQRADRYNLLGEAVRHQKTMEDQERRAARNTTYANLAANAMNAFGGIMDSYTAGKVQPVQDGSGSSVGSGVQPVQTTGEQIATAPKRSTKLATAAAATGSSDMDKAVMKDLATQPATLAAEKVATGTAATYDPAKVYDANEVMKQWEHEKKIRNPWLFK